MQHRLTRIRRWMLLALAIGAAPLSTHADLWDILGLRKKAGALSTLTEEQVASGLREALAQGIERAVAVLGKTNGFLQDAQVRIPLPPTLQRAEAVLGRLGQQARVEEFHTTLNRAAEQAVPEAAGVLADSVRRMTLEDARAILNSTNTAATDFFRRTSTTNLHMRLLPIVKTATERTGVTAGYKDLVTRSGLGGSGLLGGLGRSLLGAETLDVDDYVTSRALEGLFLKIGEEEKRIREDPAARATELLKKVFGGTAR